MPASHSRQGTLWAGRSPIMALIVATLMLAMLALSTRALPSARPAHAAPQTLTVGWNMIVYQGPALPPETAFASIHGSLRSVYILSSVDGAATWRYYVPRFPGSTLTEIVPLKAYWLNVTEEVAYEPPGAPASTPTPAPAPAVGSEGWRVVERGLATWYGPELAGNRTACGDIFDPALLTAASNTLPCGAIARVTNSNTGKSVIVKINDTGGFRPPLIIDLSQAAYESIAPPDSGSVPVTIEVQALTP